MAPRRAALNALTQVVAHKRMLSHLKPDPGLEPAEAARASRLAQTVLRHMEALDQIIASFVDRKPVPQVLMILRLGAAELLIAREEPYGVVNSAVALAKSGSTKTARASGLVNAVLRRIAEGGQAMWSEHASQRLPGWIAGPVRKAAGEETLRAIEAAHEITAPLDLTPRDGTAEVPGAERLPPGACACPIRARSRPFPVLPRAPGGCRTPQPPCPSVCSGMCTAFVYWTCVRHPGGKTLQLAAAGAEVVALDASDTRLDRLRENLARTGLRAEIVVADALEHQGAYDAILLDAPCTATGTIRRHPDLPFVKSGRETEELTRLQMRLLDHALTLLNPGGRLVFCTCSLLAVEGEYQVKAALKRHQGLSVVPADPVDARRRPDWASAEGRPAPLAQHVGRSGRDRRVLHGLPDPWGCARHE
jgi:16S rRNA (cytosine967-C5)-methyltransferase